MRAGSIHKKVPTKLLQTPEKWRTLSMPHKKTRARAGSGPGENPRKALPPGNGPGVPKSGQVFLFAPWRQLAALST